MKVSDYDFDLPERLIARFPKENRDDSRLLVVNRDSNSYNESVFHNLLDYLSPGDCLVLNDTRVYSARLYGISVRTKREHEFLLLEDYGDRCWRSLINKYRY
jgi:S-adenosylmethionine:tRNA ribosyltransferase-isomerase